MIFSVQCLAETMVHFRNIYVLKLKRKRIFGMKVKVVQWVLTLTHVHCSVGHKVGTGKLVGIKNTYIGR